MHWLTLDSPRWLSQATLHHTIQLHPQYLGKGIIDTVIQELEKEVEGENIAGVGCIVAVITVPVR